MRFPPYTPEPGSAEEIARFHELQDQLRGQFERFRADPTCPYTAVVVPSQSVDPVELAKIDGVAHYEERSLFNLMLLRQPRLRVVYVTSQRIDPLVVDYFLHHLRGVPTEHARRRLVLLECADGSPRPLTAKVLERPLLLKRIRDAIPDPDMAHLAVFNSTGLERTLSVQLGIPLNACDPELSHLGSKSGARKLFRAAGVPLSPGREDLRDEGDLAEGIVSLIEERPQARRVVVKLNDSFSGEGNALLELPPLLADAPSAGELTTRVRAALPGLRFEASGQTWEAYRAQLQGMGGVCEEWLEGRKTSPSAQLRVNPLREVQAVSTHDQVLGGPSGQVFQGAVFPADPGVRAEVQAQALRVGELLAAEGVIGRFGVDFVAVWPESGGEPHLHALEINLRQGGTTHPFNTLKFLTDGRYVEETGEFLTAQDQPRCYFATDVLSAPEYRGILPFDLLDELVVRGVHFRADDTGVVFHLLGCLSEFGKLGCTAISHSVAGARALYEEMVQIMDALSGRQPA